MESYGQRAQRISLTLTLLSRHDTQAVVTCFLRDEPDAADDGILSLLRGSLQRNSTQVPGIRRKGQNGDGETWRVERSKVEDWAATPHPAVYYVCRDQGEFVGSGVRGIWGGVLTRGSEVS